MVYKRRCPSPQYTYCRHCHAALPAPATNSRDAFCTSKCEAGFYALRCRVCEADLPADKTKRRQLCASHRCHNEFKRHFTRLLSRFYLGPEHSKSPSSYPASGLTSNAPKSSTKPNRFLDDFCDRPGRVVAGPNVSLANLKVGLDEATAARAERDVKALRVHLLRHAVGVWFQRNTPPLNVIGGHKFAGTPGIDLSLLPPEDAPTTLSDWRPSGQPAGDLPLPQFLIRTTVLVVTRPATEKSAGVTQQRRPVSKVA